MLFVGLILLVSNIQCQNPFFSAKFQSFVHEVSMVLDAGQMLNCTRNEYNVNLGKLMKVKNFGIYPGKNQSSLAQLLKAQEGILPSNRFIFYSPATMAYTMRTQFYPYELTVGNPISKLYQSVNGMAGGKGEYYSQLQTGSAIFSHLSKFKTPSGCKELKINLKSTRTSELQMNIYSDYSQPTIYQQTLGTAQNYINFNIQPWNSYSDTFFLQSSISQPSESDYNLEYEIVCTAYTGNRATCGDGILAGNELCDNGNRPGCLGCRPDPRYFCMNAQGRPSSCFLI